MSPDLEATNCPSFLVQLFNQTWLTLHPGARHASWTLQMKELLMAVFASCLLCHGHRYLYLYLGCASGGWTVTVGSHGKTALLCKLTCNDRERFTQPSVSTESSQLPPSSVMKDSCCCASWLVMKENASQK